MINIEFTTFEFSSILLTVDRQNIKSQVGSFGNTISYQFKRAIKEGITEREQRAIETLINNYLSKER